MRSLSLCNSGDFPGEHWLWSPVFLVVAVAKLPEWFQNIVDLSLPFSFLRRDASIKMIQELMSSHRIENDNMHNFDFQIDFGCV